MTKYAFFASAALALISTQASAAPLFGGSQAKPSSGRNEQAKGMAQIPVCSHRIGTLAIVEPDKQWWRELNLGSPEAIIKVFVQRSPAASPWSTAAARCATGRWSAQWPSRASSRRARTWARDR